MNLPTLRAALRTTATAHADDPVLCLALSLADGELAAIAPGAQLSADGPQARLLAALGHLPLDMRVHAVRMAIERLLPRTWRSRGWRKSERRVAR